jgi:microcystin-dependent protein
MDPYVSSIYIFGGNFAIKGFALCWGQIVAVQSNTALFSLLGTNYGGNGTSNFGLPDLRGRTAIQQGQAPGLSEYVTGEMIGVENETMINSQMPTHNHMVNASTDGGTIALPSNNFFSEAKDPDNPRSAPQFFYNTTAVNTVLNPLALSVTGSSIPFNIQQPLLGLTAMIALQGIYPARN